jgi:hypothetical protein
VHLNLFFTHLNHLLLLLLLLCVFGNVMRCGYGSHIFCPLPLVLSKIEISVGYVKRGIICNQNMQDVEIQLRRGKY